MEKINICHISDLHFGIFENKSFSQDGAPFSLPSSFINFISQLNADEKPHFLIISGDLTSISEKGEYREFLEFMDAFIEAGCFAECCFKKYTKKDRTIIIPGNHDVVREYKSGKEFGSDRLQSFKKNIAEKGYNTPLGRRKNYCYTEKEKQREKKRYACPIPCSLYYYPEYNIVFAAIVSCYFAHKINPEIKDFEKKIKKLQKDVLELQKRIGKTNITKGIINALESNIKKLIYLDFGSFPLNYMRVINRAFNNFKAKKNFKDDEYCKLIKFAVTHHHLRDLPFPQVNTENARETLELLYKHGVISILHGHVHKVLEEYHLPETWSHGISSYFSSGTVSGYGGSALNSFNMIEIYNFTDVKKMTIDIKCHEVNYGGFFTEEKKLYTNTIRKFLSSMNESKCS
ncbi:MAG: metallophosphoesterase [Candidatus Aminicenantes bacterium]|nr:MAG: metallophosphoesterase [Candidatus Aminicenantes bacterium]